MKDTWADICKLAKGTNQAKRDFSTVLLKDAGSWIDGYLQASANEKHARRNTNTAEWMLKSKAIQNHGGGQTGETAIDEAVAAGVCTRSVSCSKGRTKQANHSASPRFELRVNILIRYTPRLLKRRCALAAQRRATTSSEHCRTVCATKQPLTGGAFAHRKSLACLQLKTEHLQPPARCRRGQRRRSQRRRSQRR